MNVILRGARGQVVHPHLQGKEKINERAGAPMGGQESILTCKGKTGGENGKGHVGEYNPPMN